jgi:DNA-binding NarL/FixJ family response regulator
MTTTLKIIIADDHPIFRRGLREVIQADRGIEILDDIGDGKEALARIRELKPDVAVLDLDMPVMNGFDVVRAIQKERLDVEVIILTMYKEEDIFNEAMDLGIKGFVLKESAATDIIGGIKSVQAGKYYISPSISEYLVNRNDRQRHLMKRVPSIHMLTTSEKRILRMIAENSTSKEIASQLNISVRTVENHRANICEKLGIRGSHSLLKFAIENRSSL